MNEIIIDQIPKKLTVELQGTDTLLPEKVLKEHDEYWNERLKENPALRNGDVYTISDVVSEKEELYIKVNKTNYKHYLYTINHPDTVAPCKVIYTCSALITIDNYIVIGKMNTHTSTPGRLQFAGGGIDASDLEGEFFNLEKNIKNEIEEEIGITVGRNTASFFPKYLKRKGLNDFWAVMYEYNLNYNVRELNEIFESHVNQLEARGVKPEFSELIFVKRDNEQINQFLLEDSSTKVDYLVPILKKYAESQVGIKG